MSKTERHLGTGEIRAFQDHCLEEGDMLRVETHLSDCAVCRSLADEISDQSRIVQTCFQSLDEPDSSAAIMSSRSAFTSFETRLKIIKEELSVKKNIFTHLPRPAWIGLAVCAALVVALTFEPARTLASEFLALFRVEQVRLVQIDSSDLPQKLEDSSQLEYIFSNDVQVEQIGEPQQVSDPEEASALAGFALRLPAQIEEQPVFVVQPAGKLDLTLNLELVRGVLKDIEREDIQLPDELDGAHIRVEIPNSVTAYFGTCEFELGLDEIESDAAQSKPEGWKNCTTLIQIPSPQVSAPPDLDMNQIGEAYLQVLGMEPDEAAGFAANVNWTTTFVVPIPRYSVDYEEVQVSGTPATLIYDKGGYNQHYLLLWIKDGVIFNLSGWGEKEHALQFANSIP